MFSGLNLATNFPPLCQPFCVQGCPWHWGFPVCLWKESVFLGPSFPGHRWSPCMWGLWWVLHGNPVKTTALSSLGLQPANSSVISLPRLSSLSSQLRNSSGLLLGTPPGPVACNPPKAVGWAISALPPYTPLNSGFAVLSCLTSLVLPSTVWYISSARSGGGGKSDPCFSISVRSASITYVHLSYF